MLLICLEGNLLNFVTYYSELVIVTVLALRNTVPLFRSIAG